MPFDDRSTTDAVIAALERFKTGLEIYVKATHRTPPPPVQAPPEQQAPAQIEIGPAPAYIYGTLPAAILQRKRSPFARPGCAPANWRGCTMSMFNRKQAEPEPEVTGSEVLRLQLKRLDSRPGGSIANVARDCNEASMEAATREHALSLAKKMAGDDASAEVLRDIAKSLMGSLSGGTPPGRTLSVGESSFEISWIARSISRPKLRLSLPVIFTPSDTTFDAERDLLVQPPPPVTTIGASIPGPWRNPNPQISAAQDALHAAYKASLPPASPSKAADARADEIGPLTPKAGICAMTYKRGDLIRHDAVLRKLDTEAAAGFISGIASTPAIDCMGHIVMPHAFDASIRSKGLSGPGGIKLLDNHQSHRVAGVIKRLATVRDNLEIDAQLNLNVSYARDLYEIAKQVGGLNFSVGFRLEEFEVVEAEKSRRGEVLIVKQGELVEVSVVTFPAQAEATMSVVKGAPQNSRTRLQCLLSSDRAHEGFAECQVTDRIICVRL